jgi:hypothetical protein
LAGVLAGVMGVGVGLYSARFFLRLSECLALESAAFG